MRILSVTLTSHQPNSARLLPLLHAERGWGPPLCIHPVQLQGECPALS